jgi:hypothetical protein
MQIKKTEICFRLDTKKTHKTTRAPKEHKGYKQVKETFRKLTVHKQSKALDSNTLKVNHMPTILTHLLKHR